MADLVQRITIETAFLPPIVIEHPLDDSATQPNPVLSLLKPKITIENTLRSPIVSHPWGDPGETKWPLVRDIGIVVALAVLGVIVWRAV